MVKLYAATSHACSSDPAHVVEDSLRGNRGRLGQGHGGGAKLASRFDESNLTFCVDHAERNAKPRTVAEWLSKASGESVACQGVMTFPGWWVEVEGREAVVVAATKGLHRV